MKKFKNISSKHLDIVVVLTVLAVALIIGGFIAPPTGQIDGSVLTAVGEMFAFSALWTTIYSISRGADVTIQHGQTNITIDNDSDEEVGK